MRYKRHEHKHQEADLVSQRDMAVILGVTKRVVEKAIESGRIDTFENHKGVPKLHNLVTLQQFAANKVASKVSTPTRGQARAGMDGFAAQAVAHLPLTNPLGPQPTPKRGRRAEVPGWDPAQAPRDLTTAEHEKRELAMSRAEKERFQSRLTELKVLEKEGELVDKQKFFQKAYSLTSAIKDKLNGLPPQVAPQLVSAMEEALVSSGLPAPQVREILARSNMEHTVREAFRLGIVRALRDLTSKPLEELIRG